MELLKVVAIVRVALIVRVVVVGPVFLFEKTWKRKNCRRFEERVGGEASAVAGEALQTRVTREDKKCVPGRFNGPFGTSGGSIP